MILQCRTGGWFSAGKGKIYYLQFWAPDPLVVDAQAAAEGLVESMDLQAIDIGIVPFDEPGRVGLVGLPIWMWVENPGPQTMGPITRSAGGVTATATLDRIEWEMGDGNMVTCTTAGTPYKSEYGKQSSPDCGYKYHEDGHHTVTATSYWKITWDGLGQAGIIPMELEQSTRITIGSLRVLNQ